MPYYHIFIKYRKDGVSCNDSEFNQTEDSLRILIKRLVGGEDFIFNGKITHIPNEDDIEEIHVFETSMILTTLPSDGIHAVARDVTRIWLMEKLGEGESKRKGSDSKSIFIVHGRDHEPMKELKTMLSEFGLNPIVLHEQPSGSRTIVEKLEKHSDVGYAFVLLTPDDLGCACKDRSVLRLEAKERARQNVILEFGYFIGKLGRDRVCCLYKGNVELPSDMQGIVYIPFEESISEARDKIIKELKEAGYEIK